MSKLKSEIRKAYFLNKYVIITPGRERRPRDIKDEEVVKKSGQCPFCPENLDKKRIIDKLGQAGGKTGKVVCLKNIYPAVTLDNPRAYGTQEVIIETLDHQKEMADLSEKQIELVLKMFARRTVALEKIKNINYILCFKNQGPKSGASLDHAHSQVLATKIAPENLKEEARAMMEYRAKNKTCPYCDIIKKETRSPRKIWENKTAACFAPYASEYHYEAWIFPKRHLDNIADLQEKEFKSFAKILKKILVKLNRLDLSFNFFLHNVVSDRDQHFYLKIQPRASAWGGIELGSGLIINSIAPEAAAKFYRKR